MAGNFFSEKHLNTKALEDMTPDELVGLGHQIGEFAKTRPDITHRFLVGLRDGLAEGPHPILYGFGEILYHLWRNWYHHIATENADPPIPFDMGARPSGIGLNSWRFHKET